MVKSKIKINQIDVIKSNKKIKLEKVVKGIKDISSLFDNIKKDSISNNNNNYDQILEKNKSSNNFSHNNNINNLVSNDIDNNYITTNKKIKKNNRRKDNNLEDSRIYGIIKSNINSTIINPEAPLERIDKDSGLPVYKAHLLKVGEGGGKLFFRYY